MATTPEYLMGWTVEVSKRVNKDEAAQIVVNLGGLCGNNVTKTTNFLIVGDFDYSSGVKGGKSNKLKRAEQLIAKSSDLQILSENVFCDMLSDIEEVLNGYLKALHDGGNFFRDKTGR